MSDQPKPKPGLSSGTILPYPELVDQAAIPRTWGVRADARAPRIDIKRAELYVPTAANAEADFIRAHELCHLAITPDYQLLLKLNPRPYRRPKALNRALYLLEEARVNGVLMHVLGYAPCPDGETGVGDHTLGRGETALEAIGFYGRESFDKCYAALDDRERQICDKALACLWGPEASRNRPLGLKPAQIPTPERVIQVAEMLADAGPRSGAQAQAQAQAQSKGTAEGAGQSNPNVQISSEGEPPLLEITPEAPGPLQQAYDKALRERQVAQRNQQIVQRNLIQRKQGMNPKAISWDPWRHLVTFMRPPLTRDSVSSRYGHRHMRPSEHGLIPKHLHRVASDQMIFSNRSVGRGLSILIDVSGSTRLTYKEVSAFLEVVPAATIALYNSTRENSAGVIFIHALRGRRSSLKAFENYDMGNRNACDGPALEWLARQSQPRVWISDGFVNTPIGQAEELYDIADKIVVDNDILWYIKLHTALAAIKAGRVRELSAGRLRPSRKT